MWVLLLEELGLYTCEPAGMPNAETEQGLPNRALRSKIGAEPKIL